MPSYTALSQSSRITIATVLLWMMPIAPADAQPGALARSVKAEVTNYVEQGDRASTARHPAEALAWYEKALQLDSLSFDALWRASRELVDLGEFEPNRSEQIARYVRAERYSRLALSLRPDAADAHFHVSRAVGRAAMAASPRERVKYAMEVRSEALAALKLDPNHAGALHIMGVWNAEVMRLNPVARMFAKTFMGGKAMSSASWDEAVRYLEQAVAEEPSKPVHRLDLARVYRDMGRTADARKSFEAAIALPLVDANDDRYRTAAVSELDRLR